MYYSLRPGPSAHVTHCHDAVVLAQATWGQYVQARKQAQRGQVWSTLTGRSRSLLSLNGVLEGAGAAGKMRASCQVGVQTVPIEQIRGSEGRSQDFDRDFFPLCDHNRERWLSVATARQHGRALPPVDLIQVGDLYFVRDGHHRISVARALGQMVIEARVVVWQVEGPLPREEPVRIPGVEFVSGELRREATRLWQRVLLGVRVLMNAVEGLLRGPAIPRPGVDRL